MHDNPAADWHDLSEHYRSLYDEEIENLAADFDNLTEIAQQVLLNELSTRGLPAPGAKPAAPSWLEPTPESPGPQRRASGIDPEASVSQSSDLDAKDEHQDKDSGSTDFTWKTLLCECETTEQANQIREMLKRAGIESWVEKPGTRWSISSPRVVVAADQLEEAIEIARRPIQQEIIDESKMEVPEYELPKCPGCGAEDPVLESAEPTNSWLCEACGKQWTEPTVDAMDESQKSAP
jgi:ribosomal protein L37AE/L43A